MKKSTLSVGLLLVFLLLGTNPQSNQPYSILIRNGRVLDPASGIDQVKDILIHGERIAATTEKPPQADRVIDATGLVVAPGFVDILARIKPSHEPQRFKIKDGVTTVISMHGGPVDIDGWYRSFQKNGALVNYGTAVGHPDIREAAGQGDPYLPASEAGLEEMRSLASGSIQAGALGIGFGINYVPGSSYQEIVAMFDVAAKHGVPAHVHSRYKGSVFPETIILSVEEVIAAAAITGARAQVVHLASSAIGSMDAALGMIEGAHRQGLKIGVDIHPYLANSTRLEPALYDPGWQERFGGVSYDSIMLVNTGERLNQETFQYWRKAGATVITFFIPEEKMLMALKDPLVMIASDGVIVQGKGHPRGAGTFSRVPGRLTREEGHLTLMEALRKMTIMPAEQLERASPSMRYRGRLTPGSYADITIFDPDSIIDRATYLESAQYSKGVHYVLVNGTVVLDRGEFVDGVTPGRSIRHQED